MAHNQCTDKLFLLIMAVASNLLACEYTEWISQLPLRLALLYPKII